MATKTLEITAGTSQFEAALASATASLVEATASWKESLASVKESFAAVSEAMLAITAVMAGGAAFGEMVQSTVKLNVESAELGKQFGLSATQASVLKTALNATFLTQEQFSAAGARVLKTLNSNEGAFKELGVATRDSSGNLRPLADIILDTNTALLTFKEGTDRGLEATKIYGKGWATVAPVLRLTRDAMAEAQKTADELGLSVSKESEAMTGEYRSSMVGVHDVFEGISNVIGAAVIPILTQLGEWFRSIGPDVITAFRVALDALKVVFGAVSDSVAALWHAFVDLISIFGNGISTMFGGDSITVMQFFANTLRVIEVAFIALRTGIQVSIAVIENEFEYLEDLVHGWASVMERAFHLDWAGVQAAWKAGNEKIETDEQAHLQRLVDISTKAAHDMNEAITGTMGAKPPATPTDAPKGDQTSEGGKDQFGKRLDAWEKELALEYAALEKHHKAEMEAYKADEAEFSKAAGARISIAEEEVAAEERAYGKGSPQYEAAVKHLVDVRRQADEQLRQMADAFSKEETTRQLATIDAESKALQAKYNAHEISNAQLEAGEIALENRRNQIALAGIQARLALIDPSHDPVQYAQLNAQLESLELAHQQKITQIQTQAAQNQKKIFDQLNQGIESSFAKSIADMLTKSNSFSNSMRSMFTGMMGAVANVFAQTAAKNIATMLEQAAVGKTIRAKEMLGDAEKAASGAYSAIAGIPYVGPFLAPAAAAAAFAATLAFSSAEGGYDIGSADPGAVKLHPKEMVLPEHLADVIRGLASGGGGAGVTHNYHGDMSITHGDIKSMLSSRAAQSHLVKTLAGAYRRGARP